MALEHALLVSLLEQPSSGYHLAQRFDRSLGHFWHATHQQIYRVLGRMEADGWIRTEAVAQGDRLHKKIYSVTARGRKALSSWVRKPSDPEGVRTSLLVKLRGAAFDNPACIAAELKRHRNLHAQKLEEYVRIEASNYPHPDALDRAQRLAHLALRCGVMYEQGWVAWCDEAAHTLAEL